jgi:hypothetical protein
MKRRVLLVLAVLVVLTLMWVRLRRALESEYAGTTRAEFTGRTGAVVTGHYVQVGRSVPVSNTVPWSFEASNVSSFEFRKARPEDVVNLSMRYRSEATTANSTSHLGAQVIGVLGVVRNGIMAQEIHTNSPPPRL